MTFLPFFLVLSSLRILCAVFFFVSGNDGVERRSRWRCGERNALAAFRQAGFIWFHQTLTADRPSHYLLLIGAAGGYKLNEQG